MTVVMRLLLYNPARLETNCSREAALQGSMSDDVGNIYAVDAQDQAAHASDRCCKPPFLLVPAGGRPRIEASTYGDPDPALAGFHTREFHNTAPSN